MISRLRKLKGHLAQMTSIIFFKTVVNFRGFFFTAESMYVTCHMTHPERLSASGTVQGGFFSNAQITSDVSIQMFLTQNDKKFRLMIVGLFHTIIRNEDSSVLTLRNSDYPFKFDNRQVTG